MLSATETLSNHKYIMAHITADHEFSNKGNIISRFFTAIGNGLIAMAEANPRLKQAEALQRLSDEELGKLGMKREDIPMHVFGYTF